jgi:hypothetical protein
MSTREVEIIEAFIAALPELDGPIDAAMRYRAWRAVYARVPCTEAEFEAAMLRFLNVVKSSRRNEKRGHLRIVK